MIQPILLYILVFISGLFFGSFLNLVSDRVTKGEKIFLGRSKCDKCKKPLAPKSLIPLLSFILQKGRCANPKCNAKLSWYYPISEIATGLVFVAVAYYSGIFKMFSYATAVTFFYLLVVASFYIILTLTDLKEKIIPDKIVIPAIIFVFVFMILSAVVYFIFMRNQLMADEFGKYMLEAGYLSAQIFSALKTLGLLVVSALAIAGFFAFLVWITKGRGMGGGDIRLGLLIGLFNGFPFNLIAIFLGFVLGAVISLLMIALKRKTMKDTVPFGPFLIAGSVIAFVWGPVLLSWYIGLR